MSLNYPKPTSESTVEYDIWTRSLWSWCQELILNPSIVSNFRWNAERAFRYNAETETYERFITEPWTADSWWGAQVSPSVDFRPHG